MNEIGQSFICIQFFIVIKLLEKITLKMVVLRLILTIKTLKSGLAEPPKTLKIDFWNLEKPWNWPLKICGNPAEHHGIYIQSSVDSNADISHDYNESRPLL